MFPTLETMPPTHLAYIEWFSPIPSTLDPRHKMYKVSRSTKNGRQCASVIPAESILGSVHLIPQFGQDFPREWNSFSVLERCQSFYINPFTDIHGYLRFL